METALRDLAQQEDDLYAIVIDLSGQPYTIAIEKRLTEIYAEYRKIHQAYTDLSSGNIEALKRALFIQWYALSEPSYNTGMADLNETSEAKVIETLYHFIKTRKIDSELIWMLNYYASCDWIFERISSFKGFDKPIVNEQNDRLPDTINREAMKLRGQMGKYWNSLTRFQLN